MPEPNAPDGKADKKENVKTAQATIRIGEDELRLLFYLRRARKLAGTSTLRVELELTNTDIRPINVMQLNSDPVLVLS